MNIQKLFVSLQCKNYDYEKKSKEKSGYNTCHTDGRSLADDVFEGLSECIKQLYQ